MRALNPVVAIGRGKEARLSMLTAGGWSAGEKWKGKAVVVIMTVVEGNAMDGTP
jgi:hypothetical protein